MRRIWGSKFLDDRRLSARTSGESSSYWPALHLKAGADFTWSCVYVNNTISTLTYGPSALTNVMCNAVLPFYPVPDINNPTITCQK